MHRVSCRLPPLCQLLRGVRLTQPRFRYSLLAGAAYIGAMYTAGLPSPPLIAAFSNPLVAQARPTSARCTPHSCRWLWRAAPPASWPPLPWVRPYVIVCCAIYRCPLLCVWCLHLQRHPWPHGHACLGARPCLLLCLLPITLMDGCRACGGVCQPAPPLNYEGPQAHPAHPPLSRRFSLGFVRAMQASCPT